MEIGHDPKNESKSNKIKCPWCPYKTKNHFNDHMRTHTGERPYKCPQPQCPATFTQSSHIKSHLLVHTKEKKIECPTCHQKFARNYTMLNHQKIHRTERPFQCTLCPYSAKHGNCLTKHIQTLHSDVKPFKCDQCGYRGKTGIQLTRHLNVHLDSEAKEKIKTHSCPHCPFKSVQLVNLTSHLRTHSGERPFKCPHNDCPYAASRSHHLQSHIAGVHLGEKKFQCKFCDLSMVTRTDLNSHMRIHTGERPFKCPREGCEYAAKQATTLRNHEKRVHLGLKPFKCTQCSYAAFEAGTLRAHESRHKAMAESVGA